MTPSLRFMSASSENMLKEHREAADPELTRAFSIIGLSISALVLASIIFMYFKKTLSTSYFSSSDFFSAKMIGTIIVFSMFLISSSLGYVYAKDLIERDAQDYQGRMRVVDIEYTRQYETWTETEKDCVTTTSRDGTGSGTSNCRTTTTRYYHHYYDTILTLDWGYEWGCGNDGAVQCTNSRYTYCSRTICRSKDCSSGDDERAFERAVACGSTIFDSEIPYEPYEARMPPSQDIDWPSLVLYGDCQTCKVIDSTTSITTLERMGRASFAFAVIGGFGGLILICTLLSKTGRRWKKKQKSKPYKNQFVSSAYQPYQLSQPSEPLHPQEHEDLRFDQTDEEEVVVEADFVQEVPKDNENHYTQKNETQAKVEEAEKFHSCRAAEE